MKWIILIVIRLYWIIIPAKRRRTCLFKESCSRYVFRYTSLHGFLRGLACFRERRKQCRPGYEILYSNTCQVAVKLADGTCADEADLSPKMLSNIDMLKTFISR